MCDLEDVGERGMERSRGIIGDESHVGRGDA